MPNAMAFSFSQIEFTTHWCNFSSHSDDWLAGAFDELRSQLSANYPELPVPCFSPLPADLLGQLPAYLMAILPGRVHDDSFEPYQSKRIFVFCDGGEDFVQAYQRQNELAHWGVAIPCTLAIAWQPDKYLVWHELLHLMNAKDCYNKFGINKCPRPRCLMRRAPSRANCGDKLALCSKNVRRIQRFASEQSSSCASLD